MASLSFGGIILRASLVVALLFVVLTVIHQPAPGRLFAHNITYVHRVSVEMGNSDVILEEAESLQEPRNLTPLDKKILSFFNRLLELEQNLILASRSSANHPERNRVKQVSTQLKLVKALFEKSVYLTKLAELSSQTVDGSSSWIDWDHLLLVTKDIEEEMKVLSRQQAENDKVQGS